MPATRVRSRWVGGNLQFADDAGNIICTFDGINRRLDFPSAGTIALPQDVMRVARTTIAAPAIKTLNATPVELLPAPGAGLLIEVLSVTLHQNYGSEIFDGDRALVIGYTDGAEAITANVAHGDFHQNAADRIYIAQPALAVHATAATFLDENVGITAAAGEIGGNASDDTVWTIDVAYRVHDFS